MQQTLDLLTNPEQSFDNFIGLTNDEVKRKINFFLRSNDMHHCVIKGLKGSGKTHLIAACCHQITAHGEKACLINLKRPQHIENLLKKETLPQLVCIDDTQLATNNKELEVLLFRLYNHIEQSGKKMIWASRDFNLSPFSRKDLNSRYSAMLSLELHPNSPEENYLIIKHFIQQSQIVISNEACQLLIKEYNRDLSALTNKLKEISAYACSHKKKITLKICRNLIGYDLHQLAE